MLAHSMSSPQGQLTRCETGASEAVGWGTWPQRRRGPVNGTLCGCCSWTTARQCRLVCCALFRDRILAIGRLAHFIQAANDGVDPSGSRLRDADLRVHGQCGWQLHQPTVPPRKLTVGALCPPVSRQRLPGTPSPAPSRLRVSGRCLALRQSSSRARRSGMSFSSPYSGQAPFCVNSSASGANHG